MSTFKVEAANILEGLFPERTWTELTPTQYDQVFGLLRKSEEVANDVVQYMKTRNIKLGFHQQYKAGGGWTLLRNITLSPGDDPLNPYVLSIIIHEVFHLKQSIWMRLSMQGELRAWQYQKKCYREITGNDIGDVGEAYMGTKAYWDEMAPLDTNSRDDLLKGQQLTRKVSPDYRAECLPLFPLPQEIGFYLKQGKFKEAFQSVWNLVTCR